MKEKIRGSLRSFKTISLRRNNHFYEGIQKWSGNGTSMGLMVIHRNHGRRKRLMSLASSALIAPPRDTSQRYCWQRTWNLRWGPPGAPSRDQEHIIGRACMHGARRSRRVSIHCLWRICQRNILRCRYNDLHRSGRRSTHRRRQILHP